MKKKVFSFVLILSLYLLAMSFALQIKPTSAATKTIVMTEGETKTITIPNKQKYYTSSESNGRISSTAKYKSRKVKITALEAGKSTLTVTTTKKKKYKYTITVNAKSADATTEESQSVAGDCPHCKKKGYLKEAQITYTRNAIKTGYLKEPLISRKEFRRAHFHKSLSEAEIQRLVKSWGGVILSKFKDTSQTGEYSDFGYDILLPAQYSHLNNTSEYEQGLERLHGLQSFDCVAWWSLGDNTDNSSHYLTEWTIEDVVVEPAKRITKNTGVVECTYCGYKYIK